MASNEHLIRHRLHLEGVQVGDRVEWHGYCTACGRKGTPTTMLKHIKASRRWRYLGVEVHYWEGYHLWEHQLTGRRYAWPIEQYRAQTLRAVK